MNAVLAKETLKILFERGVREICVCPGSRNAPWIQLLTEKQEVSSGISSDQFRTYYFFEERSASFFALGRIRASGRPVAVMTTSGTAAGELLPATMEAYYSGLPLVLMTADRPRRFRGTGAPQTAEQVGIFGQYCSASVDVAGLEKPVLPAELKSPLHLNACFEEPTQKQANALPEHSVSLAPVLTPAESWQAFRAQARNPLVVVGALLPEERAGVREFLLRFSAPVYFEALSGLRECSELERVRIHVGDRIFDRAEKSGYPIDGVLRMGGIPTHRLWRDLEDRFPKMPVLCVSHLPFPGLARQASIVRGDVAGILKNFSANQSGEREEALKAQGLYEADRIAKQRLQTLLKAEPESEPGLIHRFSEMLPDGAELFLGNSLPIREWDLAAAWTDRRFEVRATRGVNGIDGQISTFLGLCRPDRSNWALLGDLTALYDLAGPWALSQLGKTRVDIVVINNGGGKIFDRMYPQREFQNPHQVSFEGLAALWGLEYVSARAVSPEWRNPPANGKSRLIELVPDESATRRFWQEYLSS